MSEQPAEPQNRAPLGALIAFAAVALLAIAVFVVVILTRSSTPPADPQTSVHSEGGAAIVDPAQQSTGVTNVEPLAISSIPLQSSTGGEVSLTDFAGRYVVLYFGYTYCPDFCPTTLTDFRLTQRQLGADAERVTFVMISVDPKRDTPAVLQTYLARFDPTFIGLTGDVETLKQVADEFGAFFLSHDTGDSEYYMVDHTATKFLVDPEGRWVAQYAYGTPVDVMAADLKARLSDS
ncbi:MAG TPA: SCO family protein [Aggregatilineales bacterium]|nr:SCO family protein [Aggregatilineales bacterium]